MFVCLAPRPGCRGCPFQPPELSPKHGRQVTDTAVRGAGSFFLFFFFSFFFFYRRHEMAMPIMIAVVMRFAPRSVLLLPHSRAQRHARQADADAEAVPTSIRLIYL